MSEHSTLSELFERFDASSVTQGTTGMAASNFLPSVGPGLSRPHTDKAHLLVCFSIVGRGGRYLRHPCACTAPSLFSAK
jgi:hypothetical protein